jgi:4-amino-4-deoxy-L-arabinose transferase-like glycosyltransferase
MTKAKQSRQTKRTAPAISNKTAPKSPSLPINWPALADRYAKPALMTVLLIAFLLRIIHLEALSLWVDEFVHVLRAKNFNNGDGPLLTEDNNGILLTVTMLPFLKIFGATTFWARVPSVLFGVGAIYLLYRLGARLFNRYVGLLAAFAATFSLYLVFWSRMARNYAIFSFFFLLLVWVFLQAFEQKKDASAASFWERNGLSAKYAMLMLPALAASLLSHQLTFFFVYSVSIYALIIAVQKIVIGSEDQFRNKYLWLGAFSMPLLVLAMPGVNDLLRAPLSLLLSPEQVDWILPQASRLSELWASQPWSSFTVYHGLLRYDLTLLYLPALAGLVVAYKLRPKAGAWLTASIVVPFLLMSFLFREPALPRYFIFVFPWVLLSAAAFFYYLFTVLSQKVWPNASNSMQYALMIFPFVFMLGSVRWSELKQFVTAAQREGHVVDSNIAEFNFTNWIDPCDFVKRKKQPGDVLMSTVSSAAAYYLQDDQVLWFRQMNYDTKQKKYVSNAPALGKKYSAATFEDFKRTVESAPRGWLLADYYFDIVFVDDRARMYAYQNLQYYPEASPDGSVRVFGWDHSKPRPQQQNMVVQLGKSSNKIASEHFMIGIPTPVYQSPTVFMKIRYQNVNSNREALVIFNDDNAVYLPPNAGKGVEEQLIELQKSWIKPGQNKVQVMYEEAVTDDPDKGFTVYYIDFTGK